MRDAGSDHETYLESDGSSCDARRHPGGVDGQSEGEHRKVGSSLVLVDYVRPHPRAFNEHSTACLSKARASRGNALLRADDAEEARWLVEHTHPGDRFFEVALMRFYIPLKLRHPVSIDTLLPLEATRPEWVKEAVGDLVQKNVKCLFWSPRMTLRHVQDSRISTSDHLEPLRIYMQENYCLVRLFKIWR